MAERDYYAPCVAERDGVIILSELIKSENYKKQFKQSESREYQSKSRLKDKSGKKKMNIAKCILVPGELEFYLLYEGKILTRTRDKIAKDTDLISLILYVQKIYRTNI